VSASAAGANLVIGVGAIDRGDDAVGLMVARQIKDARPPGVKIIETSGDGAAIMEAWKSAAIVIVIDAAHARQTPGRIHRFDAAAQPIPAQFVRHSTHAFGLAEAIELARALRQLPPRLVVYAIVGANFALGAGLDSQVQAAAKRVARQVLKEFHAPPAATVCSPEPAEKPREPPAGAA
jgi:hydrogenase maturation protease